MIQKCDVTIDKQMTINTGNYSSIKPSVSVTMKDINVKNIGEMSEKLTKLTSMYLIREIKVLNELKKQLDTGAMENMEDDILEKAIKDIEKELL